ncbi:MAG: threonine synthase [Gemmatimonadota bacterium]
MTASLHTDLAADSAAAGAAALECTLCGREYPTEQLQGLSRCCAKPLYPRYRLEPGLMSPADLVGRGPDLWRYAEVLPVRSPACRITLGEGFTPLIDAGGLASALGLGRVWVKDEGQNPTGSFKARGLSLAVSRALELGVSALAIPSAGNAGSATAAYAAAAGLEAHVVVPEDTPTPILQEIQALGADLRLVPGLITDAAAVVADGVAANGWFDLSTLKEPYRVEGKKTMGYELFEQLGGRLPDAIVYPTGGGTGLVGMWKAFDEMESLGWIDRRRPMMISVQSETCAPIVRAFDAGLEVAEPWTGEATTRANGLRVPRAVGDFLILRALRDSGGRAVAVSDADMERGVLEIGSATGVFACPEGGATWAAARALVAAHVLSPASEIVLFNTGSGLKYVAA